MLLRGQVIDLNVMYLPKCSTHNGDSTSPGFLLSCMNLIVCPMCTVWTLNCLIELLLTVAMLRAPIWQITRKRSALMKSQSKLANHGASYILAWCGGIFTIKNNLWFFPITKAHCVTGKKNCNIFLDRLLLSNRYIYLTRKWNLSLTLQSPICLYTETCPHLQQWTIYKRTSATESDI
jgi:hypothetical protein